MTSTLEYSKEELNYFKVCSVTTHTVPEGLRIVFKKLWDAKYQATHGQWQDTAKNGNDFYSMESPKSRKRNSRELAILRNGNRFEWNCTCLFFAILYSDTLGKGLDPVVRKCVEDLRQFRNKFFVNVCDGRLTDLNFQTGIQTVIAALTSLKLDIADVEAIKNQKSFPTDELRVTQQQLEEEKLRNEEPKSICVLPPKPSHEVIPRSGEVSEILEKMKRLRSTTPNIITVVYLSGNPGCGKSEIARQIGEKVFDDDSENMKDQVKFVFTLNAPNREALINSYIKLAFALNCDENFTMSIVTSNDLSPQEKLIRLKSLVALKFRKYSSWLLIVYNVTDVKSVFRYLPKMEEKTVGSGQILVTTQDSRSIVANDSSSYHLSLSRGMKSDEAIKTLSEISGIFSDKECILRVARALDFQPLALVCAAVYMRRISFIKPSVAWETYLQKLQQGKRGVMEEEYTRLSSTYSPSMTGAIKLALEKEMTKNIMMHAFQFLSAVAPDGILLEYIVQYITRCLPDEDEDLVVSTVLSSSFLLCSEDQSKEIYVHEVVHDCLQYIVRHQRKEEELQFLINVINAFSGLQKTFDQNNAMHFSGARFVIKHFTHISKKIALYTTNLCSPKILSQVKYKEFISVLRIAGKICQTHAQYNAAMNLYQTVLSITENICHPHHPSLAITLNNLGNCLSSLGKYEEAQKCHERALAIEEMAYDQNDPQLAITFSNLGNCLSSLGKYEEAQKCYERALAIAEMAYDENHAQLASMLNNLGNCLSSLGKYKEAQQCYERALAIEETAYDEKHPRLASTLNNRGNSLYKYEKDAIEISVDEMGGSYDVSRNGIILYFPPNAVAKQSVVTCSVHPKEYSPSPAGPDETLVSNIVCLSPDDVDIRQPIKVTVMHSGPDRQFGYETVVKTFNKEKDIWEEIEELNDKASLPANSIQVEINSQATLAAVTRLITDRFQVTPKGSVVNSSVREDVILEFPEGAVDKTVEGALKLMLMPETIPHAKDACPILCVDGFSNIIFLKPVIVKMPIPDHNREYLTNETRLLRLKNNKWEDVTHEINVLQFGTTHIEFHVEHFCSLWLWISQTSIQFASEIFDYISRSSPQVVCFAAFKDNEQAEVNVIGQEQKLTLVCVANHKQYEVISTMRDEGCSKLAAATGDRSMRPNDRAYLNIIGADVRGVRVASFFLSFLKSQVCRKELIVSDREENENKSNTIAVDFFPMPAESQSDLSTLCTLRIIKDKVFPGRGGSEGQRSQSAQQQPEVNEEARLLEGSYISKRQGRRSAFSTEGVGLIRKNV